MGSDYVRWLIFDQCIGLLNMSHTQLAEVMGISRPTLSLYKNRPELVTAKIADKLYDHIAFTKAQLLLTESPTNKSLLKGDEE